jgi:UDP-N-acetylmuramoyl-tripeptide--D-alanyl-D-alanine ligase
VETLSPLTLTLSGLARSAGGHLIGVDHCVDGVSADSRTLSPGTLFVALRGDRFDGHDFTTRAVERGAVGLLVDHEVPVPISQVVVKNTLQALSAWAQEHRARFRGPVVGVTGSNGKTTTKEMIGAILGRRGLCLITKGNLNNHIGVPLTLLQLTANHIHAVVEMGANHRGEIAHLAALAAPDIGLVTNAGPAHLEGFGSLEGVAHGKGELFASLGADGVAVINADDRYASLWHTLAANRRVLTFGLDAPADFSATDVVHRFDREGPHQEFTLVSPRGNVRVRLALAGVHNLRNAIGAAAAAFAAGAELDHIADGLAAVSPPKGRLEFKYAASGALIVDDAYNANPASVRVGLDAFRGSQGVRWLVLGEMMELGEESPTLHAEIGRYAREAGIVRLLAVGAQARYAAEAFGDGAMWFADVDALIAAARQDLTRDVVVLVKGSRANRLERVTAALSAPPQSSGSPSPFL